MYSPPTRKVPDHVVASIRREITSSVAEQVEGYGCDPRRQVLMLDSPTGGTPPREWRAFGATYQYRAALKAAGMRWDARGFWCGSVARLSRAALDGVPVVWAVA